ncbi:hypothetical protein T265_04975 [Opisthorchis viverrini]|uniref:Uncharacterized protein n=1 Tax=Opisthorchis viverrini TaxID=6198 RepID=A0A075AFW9_OPIVI|nr:hypothetical protein T265_04975 [Opisthorchis viverrini]KER28144.1 hypothetical protein T265_04975 [Opisthorchis viverrini]
MILFISANSGVNEIQSSVLQLQHLTVLNKRFLQCPRYSSNLLLHSLIIVADRLLEALSFRSQNNKFPRFSVDGIIGLYVSDKDGVIMASVSSEDMPDQAIQPYVATTFLSSIQQSSKLEMGALEWMVTRYEYMVICQFNYATARPPLPLFLTIVGSNNCDLGDVEPWTVTMGLPTASNVCDCVCSLKRHRASGPDDLPSALFKDVDEVLSQYLSDLYTCIWGKESVPDNWYVVTFPTQRTTHKDNDSTAVTPFRCLAAMSPEGSTMVGILPGCPSLDRSLDTEVGFETLTFRSVNSRSDHFHLAHTTQSCWKVHHPMSTKHTVISRISYQLKHELVFVR